jgi:ABC-2 type transport system ATP-binding protein
MNSILLSDVTKVFRLGLWKQKTAVSKLNLEIAFGRTVALLGANGSGKSTTLKMILGFLAPTHGEISICGASPKTRAAHKLVGYLPENPRFQRFLTGHEILRYLSSLSGMARQEREKRIDELLEMVGLTTARSERVQGYSKGMMQRLALASALLNRPKVLILDEPMSGLDPLGRHQIRELMQRVRDEMPMTTIFFSTHLLSDVETSCDTVVLLRHGKLLRHCSVSEFLTETEAYRVLVGGLSEDLRHKYDAWITRNAGPANTWLEVGGTADLSLRLNDLARDGVPVLGVYNQRNRLEEKIFGTARRME